MSLGMVDRAFGPMSMRAAQKACWDILKLIEHVKEVLRRKGSPELGGRVVAAARGAGCLSTSERLLAPGGGLWSVGPGADAQTAPRPSRLAWRRAEWMQIRRGHVSV